MGRPEGMEKKDDQIDDLSDRMKHDSGNGKNKNNWHNNNKKNKIFYYKKTNRNTLNYIST